MTFIIPQEPKSLIARVDGDTIIEIGKIDIPYTSKSVVTENGRIVSLCFGEKPKARRLKIFDIIGKYLVKKTEYKYSSIACKNNVIFLGGQFRSRNTELFACIDLSDVNFTAEELELPVKSVEGKSIDDILIWNNSLILVDNIVYPKYLFEYDISDPNDPKHIMTEGLPNNGTYEHIIKGDINDDYMVLLSSSVGMTGSNKYITISGKRNSLLSNNLGGSHLAYKKEIETGKNVFDIALIGDHLFILSSDGLEYLCLEGEITESSGVPVKCGIKVERLQKIPDNRLLVINKNEYELIELNYVKEKNCQRMAS
jgi:hypothetical protein